MPDICTVHELVFPWHRCDPGLECKGVSSIRLGYLLLVVPTRPYWAPFVKNPQSAFHNRRFSKEIQLLSLANLTMLLYKSTFSTEAKKSAVIDTTHLVHPTICSDALKILHMGSSLVWHGGVLFTQSVGCLSKNGAVSGVNQKARKHAWNTVKHKFCIWWNDLNGWMA